MIAILYLYIYIKVAESNNLLLHENSVKVKQEDLSTQ